MRASAVDVPVPGLSFGVGLLDTFRPSFRLAVTFSCIQPSCIFEFVMPLTPQATRERSG